MRGATCQRLLPPRPHSLGARSCQPCCPWICAHFSVHVYRSTCTCLICVCVCVCVFLLRIYCISLFMLLTPEFYAIESICICLHSPEHLSLWAPRPTLTPSPAGPQQSPPDDVILMTSQSRCLLFIVKTKDPGVFDLPCVTLQWCYVSSPCLPSTKKQKKQIEEWKKLMNSESWGVWAETVFGTSGRSPRWSMLGVPSCGHDKNTAKTLTPWLRHLCNNIQSVRKSFHTISQTPRSPPRSF